MTELSLSQSLSLSQGVQTGTCYQAAMDRHSIHWTCTLCYPDCSLLQKLVVTSKINVPVYYCPTLPSFSLSTFSPLLPSVPLPLLLPLPLLPPPLCLTSCIPCGMTAVFQLGHLEQN